MKFLLVLLLSLGIPFAAASQALDVRNSSGLRMSVDTDDRNPALIIVPTPRPERWLEASDHEQLTTDH